MSAEINYKNKYMELRSKYMNDLDVAFRLGFEQGGQQAQQDQMAQEQQQAQEIQQAAAGGQPGQPGEGGAPGEAAPGAPGQPGGQPGGAPDTGSEHPEGSELDQHIAKLESMIAKAEKSSPDDLKKSVQEFHSIGNDLRKLQKSWKEQSDLKKSHAAIAGIAKALHKPAFKMSKQASINLNENAKQAVSMQHRIVSDVMAKMEEEEKKAPKDIGTILAEHLAKV